MSMPFAPTTSTPGHGTIHLALLPPSTPRLKTVNYQYPLKLVSPAPTRSEDDVSSLVHTVYLLTYGGGLVAGDSIDLHVVLEASTRLILLTQGSTKLFKSPSRDILSKQCTTVTLQAGSALCYLPDPVQPFAASNFEQQQIYNLNVSSELSGGPTPSICVLDWVSNGRPANGEDWSFYRYGSRNELFLQSDCERKLLLRDNLLLDERIPTADGDIASRMDRLAVYGTLILYGPVFSRLGRFFMDEFQLLPRIGGRKWDSGSESGDEESNPNAVRRAKRHRIETKEGLLWSSASLRGCVVVKFGAPVLESARRWLHDMLGEDGTVVSHFGERSLLCLR